MQRKPGMKEKLFLATYDKPEINKTVIGLKKSLDEVNTLLNGKGKKQKK